MAESRKWLLANGVQGVFEILKRYPDGLTTAELRQQLADSEQSSPNSAVAQNPSFEDLAFSCVGAIKAGWLSIDRYRWRLSESGRKAYKITKTRYSLCPKLENSLFKVD